MLSKNPIHSNFTDYLPWIVYTSYATLVQQGVHIGHSVKNFNKYSSWMVIGSHLGLCLINMFKFMYMFRAGLFVIQHVVRKRGPIWFINMEASSQGIIKSASLLCGEYWVNKDWVHGLISNFKRISKAGKRGLHKPRALWHTGDYTWVSNFTRWGWTRNTWPRAIFVSNGEMSYNACHEAMCVGIPAVTIVDTNARYKHVNIAIPGNASSFLTVSFYNFLISMFIVYNKFTFVYNWYIYNWIAHKQTTLGKNKHKHIHAHLYTHTIVSINIFDYVTSNPISYYDDGNLYFYQDIWKYRGLRSVYMKTKNIGNTMREYISGRIDSIYAHHIHICWALTKAYVYARPQRYLRLFKRSFIGKRKAKGILKYRGKGLRGKAPLFGISMLRWLTKFAVSSRIHKSRAFNSNTRVMWRIRFEAVRGVYNKFVRRSYLYLTSEYAMLQRTIKYGIFAIALLFHIINNSSLWHPAWLQRTLARRKKTRSIYTTGYMPVNKRGKLASRIRKVLLGRVKKTLRIKYSNRMQSDNIKLYQFPTPLNLYAAMDYMRNSGTKINKRIHTNTLYNAKGNFTTRIYMPEVRSLLAKLRPKRKLKGKAMKALLLAKNKVTSQHKVVMGVTYNLPTSLNTETVKINHNSELIAYNNLSNK